MSSVVVTNSKASCSQELGPAQAQIVLSKPRKGNHVMWEAKSFKPTSPADFTDEHKFKQRV